MSFDAFQSLKGSSGASPHLIYSGNVSGVSAVDVPLGPMRSSFYLVEWDSLYLSANSHIWLAFSDNGSDFTLGTSWKTRALDALYTTYTDGFIVYGPHMRTYSRMTTDTAIHLSWGQVGAQHGDKRRFSGEAYCILSDQFPWVLTKSHSHSFDNFLQVFKLGAAQCTALSVNPSHIRIFLSTAGATFLDGNIRVYGYNITDAFGSIIGGKVPDDTQSILSYHYDFSPGISSYDITLPFDPNLQGDTGRWYKLLVRAETSTNDAGINYLFTDEDGNAFTSTTNSREAYIGSRNTSVLGDGWTWNSSTNYFTALGSDNGNGMAGVMDIYVHPDRGAALAQTGYYDTVDNQRMIFRGMNGDDDQYWKRIRFIPTTGNMGIHAILLGMDPRAIPEGLIQ